MNKDFKMLQEMYASITAPSIESNMLDVSDHLPECEHCHKQHDCECHGENTHEAIQMAKTQLLNIMHNVHEMIDGMTEEQSFAPWMTAAIAVADSSISKIKEVVLYSEG
jgi:hypothetical protein